VNETLTQNAIRLRRAGRLEEAAEIYQKILLSEPRNFEALHALGIVRYQRGQLEEAERLIGEAVSVRPGAPDANYNRACLLQKLNRTEDALRCFDRAIALKPDYVEALVNRGSLLARMNRHTEALASFDAVVASKPNIAEAWHNRAGCLIVLSRWDDAIASSDRALALVPAYADAWKLRGRALTASQRSTEALVSLEKASVFAPNDGEAWHLRGAVLQQLRRLSEALPCLDKAIALAPNNFGARTDRANLLYETERFAEAAADYSAVLDGDPNCPAYVRGYLTLCRLHICEWSTLADDRVSIARLVGEGLFVLDPVGDAILSSSPEEQLQCARTWTVQKFPPAGRSFWTGPRNPHDKIRLAYISADFRMHATAFLMAGVFDAHDGTRFETTAISSGADDKSPMRARLISAFDRFVDARNMSDLEVARLMRELEIDVVIDLKGFTAEARPAILSLRPAPVQAQYLGYPGTMGADYIDYVIGDKIVIPEDHLIHYSEKVVYLPESYQCNDRQRLVAPRLPTRSEAGLPEKGFVFCCLNNNHKILPEMFDIWMRLLKQIENSVLWLLEDNAAVRVNLRREAEARGVSGSRLVFARRTTPPEHLARQRLADLFLDTLPYNAHTTASDALWVGLPMVTTPGSTFAGRVATSLLTAVGLPELIAPSLEAYEALALKLARDRFILAGLKAKLERNRDTASLFDTVRITRHLEAAYTGMYERHLAGEPPASFAVTAQPLR
jgi:protein O-GlcNAc transferase